MNFKEVVRVGKDSVLRFAADGKPVLGFSAAFDSGFGERKKPVWLDCSAWGKRFQKLVDHIKKGQQIVVSGDIGTREYEGKTYLTLDVSDVQLLAKAK